MNSLENKIKELDNQISSLREEQKPFELTWEEESLLEKVKDSDNNNLGGAVIIIVSTLVAFFIFNFALAFIVFIITLALNLSASSHIKDLNIKLDKYDSYKSQIESLELEKDDLSQMLKKIETDNRIQEIKEGASFTISDYHNKNIKDLWGSIGSERWNKDLGAYWDRENERESQWQEQRNRDQARASRMHMVGLIKADIREAELDLMSAEKYSNKYDYAMDRLARYEAELAQYNY